MQVLIDGACTWITGEIGFTQDGYEAQFGVDHLGHFLFTNLIISRIRAARTAEYSPRIILVSSSGHEYITQGIQFDNLTFDNGVDYKRWVVYSHAKLANILYANELARRFKDEGILSFSLHTGSA